MGSTTAIDRITGLSGNLGIKIPVRASTTGNITLSGLQTIDGIAVTDNSNTSLPPDRVLVKAQTNSVQNGIYDVNTGPWTRSADFDGNRDIVNGTLIGVNEGSTLAASLWKVSGVDPIIIGTDSILFVDGTTGSATATAQAAIATAAAVAAEAAAVAAAASAALAAGSLIGTSTTSNTIGTGTKSFTTQTGLDLAVGGFINVAETSTPANYMHGQVTSYNSATGAAVFNILDSGGTGTHSDWTISVSGPAGPAGSLTSVGVSTNASYLTVGSSPLTSNGTITVNKTTGLAANQIIATPDGTTGAADLRIMVANDIPNGIVSEAKLNTSDVTTANVSTTKHGFAPKAPNDATKYLDGTGAYSSPTIGSMTLLSTQTASNSATLDFTSVITSAYDYYKFVYKITPASASNLWVRTSSNNSTFDTSGYDWGNYGWDIFGGTAIGAGTHGDASLILNGGRTVGATAGNGVSGEFDLYYPNGTDNYKGASWFASNNNNSSGPAANHGGGCRTSNSVVNAVRFMMSTGNITSGKVECYGVKNT